jgi:DNA-binding transcriptional MerR regulator/methylmalonyl-CoA mutase cobalamin-binding subunit
MIMGTNEKTGRPDAKPKALSIGALSRASRIPAETLRTWERRYGSPMPVRKPSGHRLYPAAAVEHLRRVGRLLAHGHRPGEILGLSLRELDALLSISEPQEKRPTEVSEADAFGSERLGRSIEAALRAAANLDHESLVHELRANWIRLGPLRFLQDCAGPLMVAVGKAWENKTLEVRHEHFAFACVSDFLREVREPFDRQARGPRLAAAMLPGDTHEGGLLMASALFAHRGYRVVYLGAGMPVEQIAAAATSGNIEVVAISISSAMPRRRAATAVAQLRKLLPRRMPLWVGGSGAPAALEGVERFDSLDALDARLTAPRG